jgi:hypothetical protein
VLTDPSVHNAKASGMAAGWPVAEGADYRRMLVGDPSDYRRLGLDLARPTATRPYYLTEDELEDVRAVLSTHSANHSAKRATRPNSIDFQYRGW